MTFHFSRRLHRIIASLIDSLVFVPFIMFGLFTLNLGYYFQILTNLISFVIGIAYFVFYVYKYETTIGKRYQRLKIISITGERITLKQCFLRYFTYSALSFIYIPIVIFLIMTGSQTGYNEANIMEKVSFIANGNAKLFGYFTVINYVFILSVYGPIFFHPLRRSLGDIVAGTIVVQDY